jgi:hypothetical protein
MTEPPYDAPYWQDLTDRQRLNDLVHKIAQRHACSYPDAYKTAQGIIDVPGPGTYAARLDAAGRLQEAVERLIEYHAKTT